MTSCIVHYAGFLSNGLVFDAAKGMLPSNGFGIGRQRLATDPIGVFTLTLTNVVVGSAIQIEKQDGTLVFVNRTATGTTEVFALDAYAGGSSYNDLRIKVRKGTANPKYQSFKTQVTASVGSQSVFVAQVADPIA